MGVVSPPEVKFRGRGAHPVERDWSLGGQPSCPRDMLEVGAAHLTEECPLNAHSMPGRCGNILSYTFRCLQHQPESPDGLQPCVPSWD